MTTNGAPGQWPDARAGRGERSAGGRHAGRDRRRSRRGRPAQLRYTASSPETKGGVPTVDIEIPDRPLFKAAEVCSIARVQPYVLKSWEGEFPALGASTNSGARVYRRADLELVIEIRRLLFDEGLTLGAARRKLMNEERPEPGEAVGELVGPEARERLLEVRRGLRSILELLSADRGGRRGG